MRPDDVSIGEDVPELLRGWEAEVAGDAGICEGTACGGTAGFTNLSCDIRIRERGIPVDKPYYNKIVTIKIIVGQKKNMANMRCRHNLDKPHEEGMTRVR